MKNQLLLSIALSSLFIFPTWTLADNAKKQAAKHLTFIGNYKLDKPGMRKLMKAKFTKRPKSPQGEKAFVMRWIAQHHMQLEVKKGGTYKLSVQGSLFGRPRKDTSSGTWKKKAGKLVLTRKMKRKGKKATPLICQPKGKSILCLPQGKSASNGPKIVLMFTK